MLRGVIAPSSHRSILIEIPQTSKASGENVLSIVTVTTMDYTNSNYLRTQLIE